MSVSEHLSETEGVARRVPGYRIERQLGSGSMGVVYLAEDVHLRRKVALKVLAPSLADDARFRARFMHESQVAANLDNAHIVPIYSAGESGGLLYIAMRYVEGRDLRALLATDGPLALDRAVSVVTQVAEALDAAHEQDLVHRDVKPANILVDWRKGKEHCYLCDFGITKSSGSDLTATNQLFGTYDFISPEQIQGLPVDRRADVYALGCVLYQCLTGKVPFAREENVALLWAHLHDEPPRASAARPDLDNEIDRVIAKAVAKRPEDRYATCGEFALAIRAAARVALAPAEPPPAPEQPVPEQPVALVPTDAPASADPAPLAPRAPSIPPAPSTPVPPAPPAPVPPPPSSSETRAFVPLGVPLHRRGGHAAKASRQGRRWPLVVGGAFALVLVVALIVVGFARRPSQLAAPASAVAFPTGEERALIGLMPAAFSQQCERDGVTEQGSAGVVASVRCQSEQAAHELVFTQFASPEARRGAYDYRARQARLVPDQGDCKDSGQAEHAYEAEHGVTGRIMCYEQNGSSFLAWTADQRPLLLLLATRPDADHTALYASWNELVKVPLPVVLEPPATTPPVLPLPAPTAPPGAAAPPPLAAPAPTPAPGIRPADSPGPVVQPPAPAPRPAPQPAPAPAPAPAPRPVPPDADPPDSSLLSHVPSSIRSSCSESDPSRAPGATASLACGSARYFQYSSSNQMKLVFANRVWDMKFAPGLRGEQYGGGHYILYTNGSGQAQLEWTNERLAIYSIAVGSDPDALYESWRAGNLGPV